MNGSGQSHPREQLSAYLDDQLGVEDRASIDRHLAACDECRAELEALRRLALAIADEEVPPVPVDLAGRIARSVNPPPDVRPHRRRFVVPATIAATIAAIGILVTLQYREGRIIAPAIPEPHEHAPVVDEMQRSKAPVPPPPAAPEPEVAPREEKKEEARRDALGKDMNAAPAPSLGQDLKQKAAEGAPDDETSVDAARERAASKVAAAAPTSVAGGVVGGVAGGVAGSVEGGVPEGAPSRCAEQWTDSGLRGKWEVPDVEAAARDLGQITVDVGGISLWPGSTDGRPLVLAVPRDRFDEVCYALRARGVAGLDSPPVLSGGVACAGIFVTLTAAPAPTPR